MDTLNPSGKQVETTVDLPSSQKIYDIAERFSYEDLPAFFIATNKKAGTGLLQTCSCPNPCYIIICNQALFSGVSFCCFSFGTCAAISDREQSSKLHKSSSVFVETDIFRRKRCTVLPLIWNFTLNV